MNQFICPECGSTESVDVRGVGTICKNCRYCPKLMCQVHYDNPSVVHVTKTLNTMDSSEGPDFFYDVPANDSDDTSSND